MLDPRYVEQRVRKIRPWIWLVGSLCLVGCVTDRPYFTTSNPVFFEGKYAGDPEPNLYWKETCGQFKKSSPGLCGDYDLAIVELDDWGQLREPAQLHDARRMIQQIRDEVATELEKDEIGADSITLVFFTHGWKHYATNMSCKEIEDPKDCPSDLERFRFFLQTLASRSSDQAANGHGTALTSRDKALKQLGRSRVVGVFLTWRGAVVSRDTAFLRFIGAVPNFLSFWTKDRTANRIGGAAAAYMDVAYDLSNLARKRMPMKCVDEDRVFPDHVRKVISVKGCGGEQDDDRQMVVLPKTSVIAIGHSFGGKITELGLGPSLLAGTKGRSAHASIAYMEVEELRNRRDGEGIELVGLNARIDRGPSPAVIEAEIEGLRGHPDLVGYGEEKERCRVALAKHEIPDLNGKIKDIDQMVGDLNVSIRKLEGRDRRTEGELTALLEPVSEELADLESHLLAIGVLATLDAPHRAAPCELRPPVDEGAEGVEEGLSPADCFDRRLRSLCERVVHVEMRDILGRCESLIQEASPISLPSKDQMGLLRSWRTGLDMKMKPASEKFEVLQGILSELVGKRKSKDEAIERKEALVAEREALESKLADLNKEAKKAETKNAEIAAKTEQLEEMNGFITSRNKLALGIKLTENEINLKLSEALPNPFDLVVLVNPAAPGIRALELRTAFENVDNDLQSRRDTTHKPMVVSISSATDWATEDLFPVARQVGLGYRQISMKKERFRQLTRAAPHIPEWVDFELCFKGDTCLSTCGREDKKCPTICDPDRPTFGEKALFIQTEGGRSLEYWLQQKKKNVGPYWIIHEKADLIHGHSDALSQRTMDILIGLLGQANAFRPPKPKEQIPAPNIAEAKEATHGRQPTSIH